MTVELVLEKPVSIFPMFVVARSTGLREAFWLVWTARGKNACKLQVLLVMLLHNEESNRELKSWL